MGYLVNGQCHETASDAAFSFASQFPVVGDMTMISIKSLTQPDATGAFSWVADIRQFTPQKSTNNVAQTGSFLLCDPVASHSQFQTEYAASVFVGALVAPLVFYMFGYVCRGIFSSMGLPK